MAFSVIEGVAGETKEGGPFRVKSTYYCW